MRAVQASAVDHSLRDEAPLQFEKLSSVVLDFPGRGLYLLKKSTNPLVSTGVVFTEMCLLWPSDLIVGRRDTRKASRGVAKYSPVSDKREGEGSFRRDEMTSNHFLAE